MSKKAEKMQINGDFSYVSPKDGKTYSMTPKERLFCEYYLQTYGSGVEAIIQAGYDVHKKDKEGNNLYPNKKLAAVMAYENLRKPNLAAYIDSLLDEYGFNDDNVKKQHMLLLNQHADFKSKAKAIDMFYKLKGEYAPERHDVKVKQLTINDDQYQQAIGAAAEGSSSN